jgi:Flp pilus assembly protein TadD
LLGAFDGLVHRRREILWQCVAAASVAFVVHVPALFAQFVYDDMAQVLENRWIRDLRHLGAIFSGSVWSFNNGSAASNYYRPAMHTIYAFEFQLFGLRPWGFHLVNVLLHAAVSALVVLVAARLVADLGKEREAPGFLSPALAAGLLFATHPIHTEAVVWVAALPELSFVLFGLLAFLAFVRSEGAWTPWGWLSVGLFFVSTLCKETALVLPAFLGLHALLRRQLPLGAIFRRLIPFGIAAAISLVLRFQALSGFAPEIRWGELTSFQVVLNATVLFAKYLWKLVLPVELNAFHVLHPVLSAFEPRALAGALVAAGFVALCVLAWRRSALVFFSLQTILLPLLPVLNIRFVGENAFAERYLYLPSLGFTILLALLLFRVPGRVARATLLAALVALYSAGTWRRATIWKDNFTLFQDTARKSPDHYVSQTSLANAFYERGEIDAAIERYRVALALRPNENARANLGIAYLRKGRTEEAVAELETAVRTLPRDSKSRAALGFAYETKGWLAAAVGQYEAAVSLDPDSAAYHNNLGVAYWKAGRKEKAAEHFRASVRLEPGNARYLRNLALVEPQEGAAR